MLRFARAFADKPPIEEPDQFSRVPVATPESLVYDDRLLASRWKKNKNSTSSVHFPGSLVVWQ